MEIHREEGFQNEGDPLGQNSRIAQFFSIMEKINEGNLTQSMDIDPTSDRQINVDIPLILILIVDVYSI